MTANLTISCRKFAPVFVLVLLMALVGCGIGKAVQPADPKGFIERQPEVDAGIMNERYPFQYVWVDVERNKTKQYHKATEYKIFVAPVGLNYLGELQWKDRWLRDSLDEVAVHFHDKIVEELKEAKGGTIKPIVVEDRTEADFVLEVELVEVGFGDPALYVVTFAVPLPGVATAVDAAHTAVLAFEAKVVEADTNQVVAAFADRKIPKLRLLDLNKVYSKTAPLRDISNDWAVEIARSLVVRGTDADEVKGTYAFTLVPW